MRVSVVTALHGGLVRGGLEIQVEQTIDALTRKGVEVEVVSPLSSNLGEIAHFFGTFDSYWEVGKACLTRNIPYVCSPVFLPKHDGFALKFDRLERTIRGNYPRPSKKLYRTASRIVALTSVEESKLESYFGPGLPKVHQIPNGVDRRFFDAEPTEFRKAYQIDGPFVLHTGGFDERKNQLGVIRSLGSSNLPIVFLGRTVDEGYLKKCHAAAGPGVRFLGEVPYSSSLIPSALAAARVFCLPSWGEVLSLSALEAGVVGTPMVLGNGWGAQDHFCEYAEYVNPKSESEIRDAVERLWTSEERREERSKYFQSRFTWDSVADQLISVYESVLSGSR